jgi:hypothetical protein
MKKFFYSRRGVILIVVLLALILRLWAAFRLPVDYDEPVYMQNAFDYAQAIRAGDLNGVIDYAEVNEHPPLVKLLYSLTILPLSQRAGWSDALLFSRLVSVVFGTLAVAVVALIDPVAGGLMAIQTTMVKYSSQAYLDAFPLFASLAALLAMLKSTSSRDRLVWFSAAAFGLAMAGKYSYFPILIVILYLYFWEKKYPWRNLLPYAGVVVLTFLIFDPYLWRDPLARLMDSALFHTQYAQSAHVQQINYPWYQPVLWVASSNPFKWHPEVFIYNPAEGIFSIDAIIFMLALIALPREWRQRRWVVVWIASSMLFLLLWPTKWPQYTLVVIPAFCLAASLTLRRIITWVKETEEYYGWFSNMLVRPGRWFWIIISAIVVLFIVFISANGVSIWMDRRGWSHLDSDLTGLPSNQIYEIYPEANGKMALGTDSGLAIWTAGQAEDAPDEWEVYTPQNSGLPSEVVLSILVDPDGRLWAGTQNGLASFDGQNWETYRAGDFGLPGEKVNAISRGSGDRLWIGTDSGAAAWDGQSWESYTTGNSGLMDNLVLSIAVDPQPGGDVIYFGTGNGLYRLDSASGEWEQMAPGRFTRELGGVSDLLVDSAGKLWVATLGNGISVWDGSAWTGYKASPNSLPTNRIDEITETSPGVVWIGASFPERPGGVIAYYDGNLWRRYRPYFTGYSGASTVAIARDLQNRLWFGTQSAGVDIFEPQKDDKE